MTQAGMAQQPWPPQDVWPAAPGVPSKGEKTVTWVLWGVLTLACETIGGVCLLLGVVLGLFGALGASLHQQAPGWEGAGWYVVGGGALVVLPWPALAGILVGAKKGRHVWFWPGGALVVAALTVIALGLFFHYF